jgi:membrane protease YdiL (CAAX protease family)
MPALQAISRSPLFWILALLLSVGAVVFSVRNFADAFPVVGLELEMDRDGALEAARELSVRHGWGPEGFRQAASFSDPDPQVRTYLELELGESDPLGRLRAQGIHPYRWEVRHFREGETREVSIRFTPAGEPLGFRLRLPEEAPGPALPAEEARALAEEGATLHWGMDLQGYELVESAQETRPGGRVDHVFVYLRTGADLGEGDVRLRLGVAGDLLSEVAPFVRVPQAFSLRYAEMRGANTRIALAASLLFLVLFFLVGCGYGIFHLLRTGWLEWKPALAWGGVVAAFMALGTLNQLPLSWMRYDTALSSRTFLLQRVLEAGAFLVVGTALLAVIFMAAESLGRRAFPHHPRQWRLWHPQVAPSLPAVGRTVGGYLVAAVEVGFVVAFYLFAMRRAGWWTPSEALIQPDLLATWAPWLTAVSIALFSGFWEESLFRAVPLAGAALLGARFGGRGWWIGGALILQAVLFAAGHADYPQQPAYARVVELFFPALLWGILYLWVGLVPVILAHGAYNLTLVSLPLWVSSAPGIWVDRTFLVVLGLAPLWILLVQGLRKGFRREPPEWAWNRSWSPPDPLPGGRGAPGGTEGPTLEGAPGPEEPPDAPQGTTLPVPPAPPLPRSWVLGLSALGLLLLAGSGLRLGSDVPPVEVGGRQAVGVARDALADRGLAPGPEWRALPTVSGGRGAAHRFAWEEEGPEAFRALLGSHLAEPGWVVRFARFTGPVEERAEEFRVELGGDGRVRGLAHRIPEDRPGAGLDEEDARAAARALLVREFGGAEAGGVDPVRLREVAAEPRQRPNRRDWTFTWADPDAHPLTRAEARIRIGLAGDQMTERGRFLHVPEDWEREERERGSRRGLLSGLSGGLLFLVLAGGALTGVIRWARGIFHLPSGMLVSGVAGGALLLSGVNGLPASAAGFTTTQGFGEQVVIALVGLALGAVVAGAGLGLAAGLVPSLLPGSGLPSPGPSANAGRSGREAAAVGVALGLALGGSLALWGRLADPGGPVWPSLGGAGAYLPMLAPGLSGLLPQVAWTLFLLLVVLGTARLTREGRRRVWVGAGFLFLAGLAAPRPDAPDAVLPWLLGGALAGLGLFVLVRSRGRIPAGALPWGVATVFALQALAQLPFRAFPGALPGQILAAILPLLLAGAWAPLLREGGRPPGHRGPAPPPVPLRKGD